MYEELNGKMMVELKQKKRWRLIRTERKNAIVVGATA